LIPVMAQHLQIVVEDCRIFVCLYICLAYADIVGLLLLIDFSLAVPACQGYLASVGRFERSFIRFTQLNSLIQGQTKNTLQLRRRNVLGCRLSMRASS